MEPGGAVDGGVLLDVARVLRAADSQEVQEDGSARLDVVRVLVAADSQEDVSVVDIARVLDVTPALLAADSQLDVVRVLVTADSQEDVGVLDVARVLDVAPALLAADSQLDVVLDSKEDGGAVDVAQDSVDIVPDSVDVVPDSVDMVPDSLPPGAFICSRCHLIHEDREAWNRAHSRFYPCPRCGLVHADYSIAAMLRRINVDCELFMEQYKGLLPAKASQE